MSLPGSNTVEVIAELAQGFEGKPEQARSLLQAAAAAGADAAKFQLVFADELAAPDYKHYQLFTSLEMSDESWRGVAARASELGIELQLDIFGPRSLALAESLGLEAVKLHPTDVANVGLLEAVAHSAVKRVLLGSRRHPCRRARGGAGHSRQQARGRAAWVPGLSRRPPPTTTSPAFACLPIALVNCIPGSRWDLPITRRRTARCAMRWRPPRSAPVPR